MKKLKAFVLISLGLIAIQSFALEVTPYSWRVCSSCSTIEITDDSLNNPETLLRFRTAIAKDNGVSVEKVSNKDAVLAIAYQLLEE